MDISDIYFEILPQEILYMVLYNSNMRNICTFLGYDFYKTHKQFFESIIKRDFGKYILVDLINYKSLEDRLPLSAIHEDRPLLYELFKNKYAKIVTDIVDMKDDTETTLFTRGIDIKFSDLMKIGFDVNLITNTKTCKCLDITELKGTKTLFITAFFVNQISGIKKLVFAGVPQNYFINDITLHSIFNLLFFFGNNTIFKISQF